MDKARFQHLLRSVIFVPIVVAAFLAITLVLDVRFLIQTSREVEHSDEVIKLAQRIYRGRIDQETAIRAYLLTLDKSFLQPFNQGRVDDRALEVELTELISDNPQQQERNDAAVTAFQRWSLWADEAVARTNIGEDVSDLQFQLHGKELMDQYREARAGFITAEQQLRDGRLARSRRALRWVNFTIVTLCVVIGAALAVFGRRQMMTLSQSFNKALDKAEASAHEAESQRECCTPR